MVVGVSAMSGCGDSGEGPGKDRAQARGEDKVQRMSAALKTLKGYDTVHMDGDYLDMGGKMDLRVDRRGNCVGSVEYSGQGTTEFIHVGGERAWYRYDDATLANWRSFAESVGPAAVALHDKAAKKARGKYVELSGGEVKAAQIREDQLLMVCDLDKAFAGVPDSVNAVKPRNPETRAGKRVVGLVQQAEGDEVTVYVPVTGKPLPLRVEFEINDDPVEVDLTEPDKPVKVTPPPPSETVTSAETVGLLPDVPEHMQGD